MRVHFLGKALNDQLLKQLLVEETTNS